MFQIAEQTYGERHVLIDCACIQPGLLRRVQVVMSNLLMQVADRARQRPPFQRQVDAVLSQRTDQCACGQIGGNGLPGHRSHGQRPARITEQATGHLVFTGQQRGCQLLMQAGSDVLTLLQYHHAIENFPLDRTLTLVEHGKALSTGRHGKRVR